MSDDTSNPTDADNNAENNPANDVYWKIIEEFIDQANHISSTQGLDSVSSALMYAAARFSAFNAASKYDSADALSVDKQEAVKYFSETFKKMFQQNMDEYEKNFEKYITRS